MRIYQSGTGGLWVVGLFLILMLLSVLAVSGFLLGTPIGLAILTYFVIRHFYKSYQRRKYYEQYGNSQSRQGFDFGQWTYSGSSDETDEVKASETVFNDDLGSSYRQAEQDIRLFTTDDKRSAVDVEYKEI